MKNTNTLIYDTPETLKATFIIKKNIFNVEYQRLPLKFLEIFAFQFILFPLNKSIQKIQK